MKNLLLLALLFLSLIRVSAQEYYLSAPKGFGANATGGGTATASNTVTVSDYTSLKNALNSTSASNAVILVSGSIDCIYTSVTLNNKTIIGLPGARLKNTQINALDPQGSSANSGILNIKPGSNNIIIRNLIFEGPGAFDVDGRDNLTNEGTNVWVDHCEFQDGIDGNFDNKGAADNISVTWCKFTYLKAPIANGTGGSNDHRFSDLVGSSATDKPTDGHYSVSFINCYWAEGCRERMPRARNAELHILNCYYKTSVEGALAIGLGGGVNNSSCYVENTDFAQITKKDQIYTSDQGTVALTFAGCNNRADSNGGASKPAYNYSAMATSDVATYVANSSCGAGATLLVNANGQISSSCDTLGLKNKGIGEQFKMYPTQVDSIFNIQIPQSTEAKAIINIYKTSGEKVYSMTKKASPNEKISINVAQLAKGMYLCNLKMGSNSNTWKFIKL